MVYFYFMDGAYIDRSENTDNPPENGWTVRVVHIPQVPGKPFIVVCQYASVAKGIKDMLAEYDLFLLATGNRPDYSNVNFLEVWNDGEWEDMDDDEYESL